MPRREPSDGGAVIFPLTTTLGNEEVNRRVTAAFEATVKALNAAGTLKKYKVDAGPKNIGIDVDKDNIVGSIVYLIESRKNVVGAFAANGFVTPALGDADRSSSRTTRSAPSASTSGPSSRSRSAPARSRARSGSSPSCRASGR